MKSLAEMRADLDRELDAADRRNRDRGRQMVRDRRRIVTALNLNRVRDRGTRTFYLDLLLQGGVPVAEVLGRLMADLQRWEECERMVEEADR